MQIPPLPFFLLPAPVCQISTSPKLNFKICHIKNHPRTVTITILGLTLKKNHCIKDDAYAKIFIRVFRGFFVYLHYPQQRNSNINKDKMQILFLKFEGLLFKAAILKLDSSPAKVSG